VQLTKHYFDTTDHDFTYTFYGLRPGRYAFVVCDGLEYVPEMLTQAVQPGLNRDPVSFFLTTSNAKELKDLSSPTLKGPDGQPIGRGESVFLKDVASGCMLHEERAEAGGIARFHGVPPGKYHFENEAEDRDP
jgi:hypothetical protein